MTMPSVNVCSRLPLTNVNADRLQKRKEKRRKRRRKKRKRKRRKKKRRRRRKKRRKKTLVALSAINLIQLFHFPKKIWK